MSVQSIRRARSVLSCGSSAAATFGGIASRLASFVPSGVAYLLVQFGGLMQSGQRIDGQVIDLQAGDVLVEIDSKTHGLIEESEFVEHDDLPAVGTRISANFVRFDASRELVILSVHGARKEVFWEELCVGMILEGNVTATNRGGLTLEIKGSRAFLPVSQIDLKLLPCM